MGPDTTRSSQVGRRLNNARPIVSGVATVSSNPTDSQVASGRVGPGHNKLVSTTSTSDHTAWSLYSQQVIWYSNSSLHTFLFKGFLFVFKRYNWCLNCLPSATPITPLKQCHEIHSTCWCNTQYEHRFISVSSIPFQSANKIFFSLHWKYAFYASVSCKSYHKRQKESYYCHPEP